MPPDLDDYRHAIAGSFYRKADLAVPDDLLRDLRARRRTFARLTATAVATEAARVLGIPRSTAVPCDAGTLHAVFLVTDGAGGRWYARTGLPGLPGPAGEFLVDRIAGTAASAAGVPVPTIRHVDLSRTHVPFDLALLDAADGAPAPADATGDAARRALGRTLARLHRVVGSGWGPLDPAATEPCGLHGSWRDYVLLNLDAHLAACRDDGTLGATEIDALARAFRTSEPLFTLTHGVLCHGDLAGPNVLTRAGAVTAILDWEDAVVGDPVFDLAGWGTFVGHHERRGPLLAGYGEAHALPADFDLRYWGYAVRILLAKTVHRRRFGYAETDRIPAGDRLRPAIAAFLTALQRGG